MSCTGLSTTPSIDISRVVNEAIQDIAAQPRRASHYVSATTEDGCSGLDAHAFRGKPYLKPGVEPFFEAGYRWL